MTSINILASATFCRHLYTICMCYHMGAVCLRCCLKIHPEIQLKSCTLLWSDPVSLNRPKTKNSQQNYVFFYGISHYTPTINFSTKQQLFGEFPLANRFSLFYTELQVFPNTTFHPSEMLLRLQGVMR